MRASVGHQPHVPNFFSGVRVRSRQLMAIPSFDMFGCQSMVGPVLSSNRSAFVLLHDIYSAMNIRIPLLRLYTLLQIRHQGKIVTI